MTGLYSAVYVDLILFVGGCQWYFFCHAPL